MAEQIIPDDSPDSVRAQIAFVKEEWRERPDPPRIYSGASRRENTQRHDVTIHNARIRAAAGDLDLDQSGFILVDHPTDFSDFDDEEAVRSIYFPRMRRLMLTLTGAHDAVDIGFYQVRSHDPAHFFDAFSLYMHCDFTPGSIQRFAESLMKDQRRQYPADEWDYAWYNLWRPIGAEVEKDPLVLMDASTLAREDIIDYCPVKENDRARAAVPLFDEQQRFYYVPRMRPDEVLVFKQLDSRPDRSLVCPHTSFVDPNAALDARERRSIDIRFMCVFPKEDSSRQQEKNRV